MYRTYIQPLTEKTKSKSVDEELVINIENQNISVNDNDKLVSSLKEIKSEIYMYQKLFNSIVAILSTITTNLDTTTSKYNSEKNEIDKLLNRLENLETRMKEIISTLENNETINEENYNNILIFYNETTKLVPDFLNYLFNIETFRRKMEELKHFMSHIGHTNIDEEPSENSVEKYLQDYIKVTYDDNDKASFSGYLLQALSLITNLVNSKANQSDYDNYIKDLVNKYNTLKNSYSKVIKKFNFKFN